MKLQLLKIRIKVKEHDPKSAVWERDRATLLMKPTVNGGGDLHLCI
jgi:hypothetical protein